MKYKKYHTIRAIPQSKIKIVERGKMDTPNPQIHDVLNFPDLVQALQ
jgi:hypothetical protein